MASPIERWPPEVMETVVACLTLADLSSLRLASKGLALLVAQGGFKQYYRTKHVDVSPASLAAFAQMTQAGLLGARVENLVLTGLAVDTSHLDRTVEEKARWVTEGNGPLFCSTQHKLTDDEVRKVTDDLDALRRRKAELKQLHASGEDAALLTEAFANVAAYGNRGRLQSLTLEVDLLQENENDRQKPIEARDKIAVWWAGQAMFRAVMSGMAKSGLPLEKLDAFTGQWHCSLSWIALECVRKLSASSIAQSLGALKSLSLSLSADSSEVKKTNDGDIAVEEQSDDTGYSVLAEFLTLCPDLEHLHLHWCVLQRTKHDDPTEDKLLQHSIEAKALNKVADLTMRGFRTTGSTVLDLIKSAPIKTLRLENIHVEDPNPNEEESDEDGEQDSRPALLSPAWSEIFSYCSSAAANVDSVYFDDLWGRSLIHFKDSNCPSKMPWTPYTATTPTLERGGKDLKHEIEYTYMRGRPIGSPQAYNWRLQRRREYGPV